MKTYDDSRIDSLIWQAIALKVPESISFL